MYYQPQSYYGAQTPWWGTQNPQYGAGLPTAGAVPQPPRQVAANQKASLFGDGRIQEADGGQYKFQSTGTYSLLKDKGIDLRGNFEQSAGLDRLVLDEAGLIIGDQTLNIGADGVVSLSGANGAYSHIAEGQSQDLGQGTKLTRQGQNVKVQTSEYTLTFEMEQAGQKAINIKVETGANGVSEDGVMPSGLLGETFDADNRRQSYLRNQLRDGGYKQNDLPGKIYKWDPAQGKIGYVETLYTNILGRPPATQEEMFQLSDKMTAEGSRGAVVHLMNSEEFKAKNYSPERKAEILYKAIFNRKANTEELANMAGKLNGGQELNSVVDEMTYSQEYFDQYKIGKMPSAMSNKESTQILNDRFNDIWKLDRGRNNGYDIQHGFIYTFNPVIHRRHLEAVLSNDNFDLRTKVAAKNVLDNESLFRELDAANGKNAPDDIITPKDFEAFLKNDKINTY